jgi:hypothetical protein
MDKMDLEMTVRGDMKIDQAKLNRERARGNSRGGKSFPRVITDIFLFVFAGSVCFGLTKGLIRYQQSPSRGLPYHDRFVSSDNREWSAYGGNWKQQAGTMLNESNERGAKLVTGSSYWKNYTLEADVALRSLGDAGLIARVSDAEQGVDAYNGFYAGLRIRDQSLVLGIADHDWKEIALKSLSSPIVPDSWYHLRLELKGCQVSSVVTDKNSAELARLQINFDSCPLRGKVGLRSYDSGGMWKNIRVTNLVDSP